MHPLPYHTIKVEQQEHWRRAELRRLFLIGERSSTQRRRAPRVISVKVLRTSFRRLFSLANVSLRPQG